MCHMPGDRINRNIRILFPDPRGCDKKCSELKILYQRVIFDRLDLTYKPLVRKYIRVYHAM